jgi:phage terminase large subunit-like protein
MINPTVTSPTWIFDGSDIPDPHGRGEKAVRFLKALRHPKSSLPGRRFELPLFWERIVRRIYGPSDENGQRLTRTVYIQIPRGARKTTFGAALALLHAVGYERTPGGLCLVAAGAEDQAELAFDEALSFVKATPRFLDSMRVIESELTLEHAKSGSILRAIPAEGDVQHGKTPTFVLVDELHVWKNRKLWRALKTGLLKTPNTLLVIITTAGRGHENLGREEYDYAKKVASGSIANPAYLPIIFEPPAKYDWRDERIWHAVNPGLAHGFPDLTGMRQAALEAADKPGDRDDFRQYNLNEWLDQSLSPFVDMAVYDEGSAPIDLAALEGKPCWLGVDLSSNSDLTAVVAAWREGDDGYAVHPWFFCPADNLRGRADRDGVPYPQWASEGFIQPTPGNVVDFRAVETLLRELCARFDVREIAFDPHLARNMLNNLLESGLPAVEMRQGWVTMAPAVKELERAIVGRKVRHGAHPVLRWNFENIAVATDSAGNRTFHKGKSRDRIDGAQAAAMAVGRASANGGREHSFLDDPAITAADLVW